MGNEGYKVLSPGKYKSLSLNSTLKEARPPSRGWRSNEHAEAAPSGATPEAEKPPTDHRADSLVQKQVTNRHPNPRETVCHHLLPVRPRLHYRMFYVAPKALPLMILGVSRKSPTWGPSAPGKS